MYYTIVVSLEMSDEPIWFVWDCVGKYDGDW